MGGLMGGKSKASTVVQQTIPEPEKTAEAAEVGNVRKAEDEELFGSSTPDLRVDRPTVSGASGGSGLKLM